MQVEDVKRWHWCLIGILAGLGMAAIGQWAGPRDNGDSCSPYEFESQLKYRRYRRDVILGISALKLHPPMTIYQGTRQERKAEYASYTLSMRDVRADPKSKPRQVRYNVLIDDVKGIPNSALGSVKGMTVKEYLDKLKVHLDGLDKNRFKNVLPLNYKVAWIEDKKMSYLIYGGGGFLIVGIIWPTILSFLVGAGFGRARSEEETMDLSKYKSRPEPKAAKPVVTQEDHDKLRELEEELEASLRAGALESAPSATVGAPAAAAPIKKLTAAPLAPPPEEKKAEGKPKDFGTDQEDFYPTEVHGKKKTGE